MYVGQDKTYDANKSYQLGKIYVKCSLSIAVNERSLYQYSRSIYKYGEDKNTWFLKNLTEVN